MKGIYAVSWVTRDRDNYDVERHEDEFYSDRAVCQQEVDRRNTKARAWAEPGPRRVPVTTKGTSIPLESLS